MGKPKRPKGYYSAVEVDGEAITYHVTGDPGVEPIMQELVTAAVRHMRTLFCCKCHKRLEPFEIEVNDWVDTPKDQRVCSPCEG